MISMRSLLGQLQLWCNLHRRVPVFRQLSNVECGAACLAMILNYYGRQVSVSECREQCGISRDGTTAEALVKAARCYDLCVRAFYIQDLSILKAIQLPAIAHWNFNHFIVIERWLPERVEIIDPALGRRRLTINELNNGFTGVALVMTPGTHFERRTDAGAGCPNWRSYVRHVFAAPGLPVLLLQVVAASLLLQILGLALPLFTKIVVDQVLPFRLTNIMTILGVSILVLVLTQVVISYLRITLLIYVQARLDSQLMLRFYEHLLALPYRFFQQRSSGDLLMRLGSNTMLREMLTGRTISAVLDSILVLGYFLVLLVLSPQFALLVLSVGLVQIGLLVATIQSVRQLLQQDLAAQAESQSYLVESLKGIVTVKSSGAEAQVLDHWSNLFYKQLNISLQRSHLSAIIETAMGAVRTFTPPMLLWVGAGYVLNDTLRLGEMLALNTLGIAILTPLASLVSTAQALQLSGVYLDRIMDVLETDPEQTNGEKITPALSGQIEVKNVSFRHSPNAPFSLRDISFKVRPGQKIALVGQTGSGKSTLAMLLLGLFRPQDGEIYYDGIPLDSLCYRALRTQFGVVQQELFLFSGSIRHNIAFTKPDLSLDQIRTAARAAAIDYEIMQMPMTYETLVAEGGSALSGGQRQRLAIARAIVGKPAILLLDEATSHLDTETEKVVNHELNALDCTRIIIAHRLSTIRDAELILVLHEGRLAEQGTHEHLLSLGGHYSRLVSDQAECTEKDRFIAITT
jgi:ATP-binding cassette, subfamily B, bacterial